MVTQQNVSLVDVEQLVILNTTSPIVAAAFDEETKPHRHHPHGYVQPASHSRADYPVIWEWLSFPEDTNNSTNIANEFSDRNRFDER